MRRSMKRFCRVLVLAAVMVVPLLLVAGPALAVSPFEGNPPGKQLDGKHDINGRLIETDRWYGDIAPNGTLLDGYIERVFYDVRSSDLRLSGTMVLDVQWAILAPGENVPFGGSWEMKDKNGNPIWNDADFEGLESANYLFGKPFQLSVSGDAVGVEGSANEGMVLHYRVHRASANPDHPSKSTLTLKAYIEPAPAD